jgi:hypothetical protein
MRDILAPLVPFARTDPRPDPAWRAAVLDLHHDIDNALALVSPFEAAAKTVPTSDLGVLAFDLLPVVQNALCQLDRVSPRKTRLTNARKLEEKSIARINGDVK